jgi:hypothetical protein
MGKVILDQELEAKLHGVHQQLELCNAAGHTMGRYVPEELYQKLLYQLAEAHRPALSVDESNRRRRLTGSKSLAEVLRGLKAS